MLKLSNSIIAPILLLSFIMFINACTGENTVDQEAIAESNAPKKVKIKKKQFSSLGSQLFLLCEACHNVEAEGTTKIGPSLHGIFGSKAASKKGFAYSDALKGSSIVWDEATMRSWIKNPAAMVPGTTMAFAGVTDEAKQNALIEYLKEATN